MRRMLIVDDEAIVRKGIRETINWQDYGIEIVGEAKNGNEGYDKVLELKPEVVLSDIKMPGLDGVELAKKIDALAQDIAIVILSGYQDFAFAKGALENGAIEYLLKPIDNQELVNSVLRAIAKIDALKKLKRESQTLSETKPLIVQRFLDDLFFGLGEVDLSLITRNSDLGIDLLKSGVVVYGVSDDLHDKFDVKVADQVMADLEVCLREEFAPTELFSHRNKDQLFFLIPLCDNLNAKLESAVEKYASKREETVSIGVSDPYLSVEELKKCIKEAKERAANKLFPLINSIHGSDFASDNLKPIIMETMNYIANNYHKNLTVKAVAEALYVSESYLLHTFKENVHKTFNDCLTSYRILMAKKLLQESNPRIYEVAEKVGYFDVKYFSQIFKKKVGLTPSEYRLAKEAEQR
ncbi:MAG: response regulator [Bacilli bacterium]|nr:response regulator [Bacilli bacterium]MBN2696850.1 response regulator [Bacilli bacterium]